ncbi:unnamed protein product [Euphydryas editha]|uniref:Uncharacterized protein n=1 Tax=Euphydryas editha TaxID=104508 RepID=A0AAU9TCZ3_EUPED|nr:unnamed protein product [Euphydryas editha]
MGKCCAAYGCLSGRKTSKNLRKVTLFKAPKDVDMRRKWSSALDKELKISSFICELHFNPKDVIKNKKQVLKDGSTFVYEYDKVHLKKNAVPKSDATNKENNYSLLSDDASSNTSDIINDDVIGDCSLNTELAPIESINVDEINNEVIEADNNNSTNPNLPDGTNNVITSDNLLIINKPEEFSLYSIEKTFDVQPLRKNWSWTVVKDSYISLSYINLKLELVCHVKIDKDLNVTIVNAKTNILINMDVNISSIDCVWQLLRYLENSFFCSGTGYNDKKCSQSCSGILLSDEKYKKKMEEHRCISCRKLRCLLQRRKHKMTDYEVRLINVIRRLFLERRKLKRVVEQIKSSQQKLLNLKNQRAEIEEEVVRRVEESKVTPELSAQCARSSKNARSLSVHRERVHLGVKRAVRRRLPRAPHDRAVCEVCGFQCATTAKLKYHQRKHTGERPSHCTQCPKKFYNNQLLKKHMMIHTGERPYKCQKCPKAFITKTALKRHDLTTAKLKYHQRKHTGERPSHCTQCPKKFYNNQLLKVSL